MLKIGAAGGVGQLLAAAVAAVLLRLFSGPGPALLPEPDDDDDTNNDDVPVNGKVPPVTIKWTNITCSLSDKSNKSVSLSLFLCARISV